MPAKVGIKSCRFAGECISSIHIYIDVATQLGLCWHEQTHIVANTACIVGNQQILS